MKKILIEPITILRDTNKISELCNKVNQPIFITKNGTNDLVIMSDDVYCNLNNESIKAPLNIKKSVDKININNNDTFNFIRVGCHSICTSLLNVDKNIQSIKEEIEKGILNKEKIMIFSELSLTGYSCGDMFFQNELLNKAYQGLLKLKHYSKGIKALIIVGLPFIINGKIYNVAAILNNGKIKGIVPKSYLPNYNEFYEVRYFSSGKDLNVTLDIEGETIPCSPRLLFTSNENNNIKVGIEICEDLWSYDPINIELAKSGATIICNLSASNEVVGKSKYRKDLISTTSKRLNLAYIYCSAGLGESTTDLVYGGSSFIFNNGMLIKESGLFKNNSIFADIDIGISLSERLHKTYNENSMTCKYISCDITDENLYEEEINRFPFLSEDKNDYKEIISYQSNALACRLKHINSRPVIGVSGGLDSTLALIVCAEAMKILNKPSSDIVAISMPSFGTSKKTKNNAEKLANLFKVNFKEIDIKESVEIHLNAIGHDKNTQDITYENAQARERTQILMDIANSCNGMVIGTGDLSEACLGWSTYNGDQMSNYAVNISVPKTLVKELVRYYGEANSNLKEVLFDILDTPISPELTSYSERKLDQKTESIIGPYELHDFFIYCVLKYCFGPKKTFYLAQKAFKNYEREEILKWLKVFYKRFVTMQFKRSCLPDGVKVTEVSISPRGDLRMPSDGSYNLFLNELDEL